MIHTGMDANGDGEIDSTEKMYAVLIQTSRKNMNTFGMPESSTMTAKGDSRLTWQ